MDNEEDWYPATCSCRVSELDALRHDSRCPYRESVVARNERRAHAARATVETQPDIAIAAERRARE